MNEHMEWPEEPKVEMTNEEGTSTTAVHMSEAENEDWLNSISKGEDEEEQTADNTPASSM